MPRSILLGRPWPQPGEPVFLPEDTALAIALTEQEAAEEADQCPMCGLSKKVCRDQSTQFRWKAEGEQCHASYAIAAASGAGAKESSERSQAWSAYLRHN